MEDQHYLVPEQEKGSQKNFSYSVMAESISDAADWFVDAKEQLLDINSWGNYSPLLSASFRLTDCHGKEVKRAAHKGDHVKMGKLPQGTAHDGGEWVHVEAIEYDDYPDHDIETFALRIRFSANPMADNNDIIPISGQAATGTFVLERRGRKLIAIYHGRNEVPGEMGNTTGTVSTDNAVAATSQGLSDAQWNSLLKGFLE